MKPIDGITDEKAAYMEIEEKLEIPALRLGYIPRGMDFEKLFLSENCCIMKFIYNEQYFRIYQIGTIYEKNGVHGSDRKIKKSEIYNPWIGKKLEIYQEELASGKNDYSVDIKSRDGGTSYYISGIIEEEEFLKIVEGLYISK